MFVWNGVKILALMFHTKQTDVWNMSRNLGHIPDKIGTILNKAVTIPDKAGTTLDKIGTIRKKLALFWTKLALFWTELALFQTKFSYRGHIPDKYLYLLEHDQKSWHYFKGRKFRGY